MEAGDSKKWKTGMVGLGKWGYWLKLTSGTDLAASSSSSKNSSCLKLNILAMMFLGTC